MAVVSGWALAFAKHTHDRWLKRTFLIEGIFVLFFTQWYLSRYYHLFPRLGLWEKVGAIIILSLGVFVGGWLWDRKHPPGDLTDHIPSL